MMTRSTLSLAGLLVAGSAFAEDATPSFELAPVQVDATALPSRHELDPFGNSKQPVWTLAQRFSFSDVYVRPEGMRTVGVGGGSDFERGTLNGKSNTEAAETVEVGLAHGWQVGLSAIQDVTATQNSEVTWGGRLEVRKTLAPWGEIWGNPTLAASYTESEATDDTLKLGVLLGGNITDRWSWALNGNYSHNFEKFNRYDAETLSGGAMYSLVDNLLSFGVEAVVEVSQVQEHNDQHGNGAYAGIGPSFSWRPVVCGHVVTVHAAVLPLDLRSGGHDEVPHNVVSFGITTNF
jgi:hypothetical protein